MFYISNQSSTLYDHVKVDVLSIVGPYCSSIPVRFFAILFARTQATTLHLIDPMTLREPLRLFATTYSFCIFAFALFVFKHLLLCQTNTFNKTYLAPSTFVCSSNINQPHLLSTQLNISISVYSTFSKRSSCADFSNC